MKLYLKRKKKKEKKKKKKAKYNLYILLRITAATSVESSGSFVRNGDYDSNKYCKFKFKSLNHLNLSL